MTSTSKFDNKKVTDVCDKFIVWCLMKFDKKLNVENVRKFLEDEDKMEEFKFECSNNYLKGRFDIVKYANKTVDFDIQQLFCADICCEMIQQISEYAKEFDLGVEDLFQLRKFNIQNVLRGWFYWYLNNELDEVALFGIVISRMKQIESGYVSGNDEDSDDEDSDDDGNMEHIPWCYADDKNAVCRCLAPCELPSPYNSDGEKESDDEDSDEDSEDKEVLVEEGVWCHADDCRGGRAFQLKDKMFCSPACGNKHFNLKKGDEDFWEEEEEK